MDALLSIAQMPPGVPVACMAVDGAKNAGLYAARIIKPLIPRYTREEIGAVWTQQRKMEGWLEVELAVTEALADAGVVPASRREACRERASVHASRRSRSASGRPTTTSPRSSTSSPRRSGRRGAGSTTA